MICPNCEYRCDYVVQNPDGETRCFHCLEKECGPCDACGTPRWEYDLACVQVQQGIEHWCPACINLGARRCFDCGEVFANSYPYGRQMWQGFICNNCFDANYFECVDCGGIFDHEDSCSSGGYFCGECAGNLEYGPGQYTNTKGYDAVGSTRRFGIELETNYCPRYEAQRGGTWGAKEDGSVDGMEFYSPILQGDSAFDHIEDLCNYAKKHKWDVDDDCGYHLHLDMTNETNNKLYAIAYAYRAFQSVFEEFVNESRRDNTFCKRCGWSLNDLADWHGEGDFKNFARYEDRYTWFNIRAYRSYKTFEIRNYQGTLNAEEICNWVKLHTRFADWAHKLGYKRVVKKLRGKDKYELLDLLTKIVGKEVVNYYEVLCAV